MKVLIINAGSSSLKYQLIDMETETMLAKGNCEKIGQEMGIFGHKTADGRDKWYEVTMKDHAEAFVQVKNALIHPSVGVINNLSEVTAIGHRVVQGGALFSKSVIIDENVLHGIESLNPLAPLHNPAHVQGIKACMKAFGPDIPEIAVFDTAFHSSMPDKAYMFAIPYEYYEKYQIRRYGFHGTSHRYVSERCAEIMGRKDLKIISCHIGNGSSITAIQNGKVLDTSMGLTPLDGFMMGTRTGTLDPSVVTFIAEKEGLTPTELSDLFNKKSGLLGVSGVSSDDRDVTKAEREGNPRAILAHKMLVYQIQKFIGSYVAAMNGVDAIIFTAGLGENQAFLRERILKDLTWLGIDLDNDENEKARGIEGEITTFDSKVKAFVIPTNEELVIGRDTKALVESLKCL